MREKDLKTIEEGLGDLAAQAEMDHEIQMARSELYKIAKYAIKLHEMLKGRSEEQGLEAWQQSKITKAADYIASVYHNLEYEMKFGTQMAEADELRARGGIEAVNKKPRAGQTDYRDIPAGNYPGSQRKFSDKDREEQPGRLKAAIKSTLGKHTKPKLPEGDGDAQLTPGMKVKGGTIVKVKDNTVVVKRSNGDLETMNIHDVTMAEGAMPASVIKAKEKIRMSSAEENKKRFAGKTKAELTQMSRRHGHGDKNPYIKFHDGVTESVQAVAEGSAHGYNVTKFYRKFRDQSKITRWLKKEAGLPKETKLYFDDADLVLGSDTIVPYALVDERLKFNDLLTALVKVTGGTSKEKVDGVYRAQGVAEEKQKGVDGKACWDGYKRMGTKQKGGKTVDNCVKEDSYKLELAQQLDEKSKSKAQQKFMGMVYAAKKGEKPASKDVAKVAKGMSKSDAKDFASTKHKGKPEHVKKD